MNYIFSAQEEGRLRADDLIMVGRVYLYSICVPISLVEAYTFGPLSCAPIHVVSSLRRKPRFSTFCCRYLKFLQFLLNGSDRC